MTYANSEPEIEKALKNNDQMHFNHPSICILHNAEPGSIECLVCLRWSPSFANLQNIPFGIGPRVMAITKTIVDCVTSILFGADCHGIDLAGWGTPCIWQRDRRVSIFVVETMFLSYCDFSMPLEEMQHSNIYLAYGGLLVVSQYC